MKKQLVAVSSAFVLCSSLVACSSNGYYVRNRDVGTVAGAVGGGVLGNAVTGGSTAGTIIGALGGGFVGYNVGKATEHH